MSFSKRARNTDGAGLCENAPTVNKPKMNSASHDNLESSLRFIGLCLAFEKSPAEPRAGRKPIT
jgi:hypothetical protein